MARPRRSEQTREALIQAGIEQLLTTGYHGTGIKQILDVVNVPKGSFYNYFPSKEAFVAELISDYSQQISQKLSDYIKASPESPMETIRSVHNYMLQEFSQNDCKQGCLIGNIAAEIGNTSELCQQAMTKSIQNWQKILSSLIQAAQESGDIRTDIPASQITDIFWATWEGSLLRAKLEGDTKAAEQVLDLLLNRLLKP